jgi:DNA-binding PadR family transcriptional regulator
MIFRWFTAYIRSRQQVILRLLRDRGDLYGLELVEASDGKLRRGSVYVYLSDLEDSGFVTSYLPKGSTVQRRKYKITGLGNAEFMRAEKS